MQNRFFKENLLQLSTFFLIVQLQIVRISVSILIFQVLSFSAHVCIHGKNLEMKSLNALVILKILSFQGTLKYGKASILLHINIFYSPNVIYWCSKQVQMELRKVCLREMTKTPTSLSCKIILTFHWDCCPIRSFKCKILYTQISYNLLTYHVINFQYLDNFRSSISPYICIWGKKNTIAPSCNKAENVINI